MFLYLYVSSADAVLCHLQDQSFASLQYHISDIARELQDEILAHLLELHLQFGKIYLGLDGRGSRKLRHVNPPDLSIMFALNRRWLQKAKNILYLENIWVMPRKGNLQKGFFDHWHAEELTGSYRIRDISWKPQRDLFEHYAASSKLETK